MRIFRFLHAKRLTVILGSSLICVLGFVAGCETDPTSPAAVAENKAKQEDELKARQAAYGKTGNPSSVPQRGGQHRPKS
jgi:hypothetical protein